MKNSEMFDAIAHIDEDLVDRCLNDSGAHDMRNTSSERRRTVFSCIAAAAMLLFTIGLMAFLHIGRESPWHPGTETTESPDITEAILTEAPTQDPAAALSEDAQALRRYFELTDENGVKNGEKLFPDYNPNDPLSWKDEEPNNLKTVAFNENGDLTSLEFRCEENKPVTLAGGLDLSGFKKLDSFWTVFLDFGGDVVCDMNKSEDPNKLNDLIFRHADGEAIYRGGYLEFIHMLSAKHTLVEMTSETEDPDWNTPDFEVEVYVEGAGYAGVSGHSNENSYEVFLEAEPLPGRRFLGWVDEEGEVVSTKPQCSFFEDASPYSDSAKKMSRQFTAVFDPDVTGTPEGYDPHEYAVLAEFFSTPVNSSSSETIGEDCYGDSKSLYSINDPSSWHTDYHGVKWDPSGHVTEITMSPSYHELHAELDLSGFEKLEKVTIWDATLDKLTIADCPKLTDGCMVYTGSAFGEAHIEAGFVDQLRVSSRTHVYCSLLSNEGQPFTLDLTAEGSGSVTASSAMVDGKYRVTAWAGADNYVDFLGWYDESGNLVTTEQSIPLTGEDYSLPISGEHKYTARFSQPPAPTPLPEGDYFCEIVPNVTSHIDIDGDGREDDVLISIEMDDFDSEMTINITLASDPDNTFVFEMEPYPGDVCGAAVDFDPADGHIEIVVSYDCEDLDYITCVYRLKDDGSGFDVFTDYIEVTLTEDCHGWYHHGIPESFVFEADRGLEFCKRTKILGTTFVYNRFTVDKDGIRYLDGEFTYRDDSFKFTLKRELEVKLENGQTKTLRKGARFEAYSTDRESFVKIKLEDGRIGLVEVTFGNPETRWPILLNGVDQDEYADIGYAD